MSVTEYGLIGHPLAHSLSPYIHHSLMESAGINGTYQLFEIPPDQFHAQFEQLVQKTDGLNCTIPYKERVIKHLDDLDETARKIGAVNTIHRRTGYNTDYLAFKQTCSLHPENPVLVLGAGGVSRTLAYAAAEAGCRVWVTARRPEQAEHLIAHISRQLPQSSVAVLRSLDDWRTLAKKRTAKQKSWILLNGTPVGLWPHVSEMPVQPEDLDYCAQVYDTIYNPVTTKLVLMARSRNIPADSGLGMLFEQAVQAQKIWHPDIEFKTVDCLRIRQGMTQVLMKQSPITLVLTGFMGSGKTTVGRLLAERLGWSFSDLDSRIESKAGQTIPELFARQGEAVFRRLEQELLAEALNEPVGQVLATGGGAMIQPGSAAMQQSSRSLVVFLDASLQHIRSRIGQAQGRPMLADQSDEHMAALFRERYSRYLSIADLTVSADCSPEQISQTILMKLGLEG